MEAADQIQEVAESAGADDRFRARAALLIAVLAALLALTSLGGGNVAEDMIANNIQASDTWAFYQAKNIRQTANKLAADNLELQLAIHGRSLDAATRTALQKQIAEYRATADRYESEPDPEDPDNPLKGEGKKQLRAQAEAYEKQREHAMRQDPNFDFAEALFQIGIVLGSVAILATSRPVLLMAGVAGLLASLLMLNGFFLWVALPF
jgi:hypothetical protein